MVVFFCILLLTFTIGCKHNTGTPHPLPPIDTEESEQPTETEETIEEKPQDTKPTFEEQLQPVPNLDITILDKSKQEIAAWVNELNRWPHTALPSSFEFKYYDQAIRHLEQLLTPHEALQFINHYYRYDNQTKKYYQLDGYDTHPDLSAWDPEQMTIEHDNRVNKVTLGFQGKNEYDYDPSIAIGAVFEIRNQKLYPLLLKTYLPQESKYEIGGIHLGMTSQQVAEILGEPEKEVIAIGSSEHSMEYWISWKYPNGFDVILGELTSRVIAIEINSSTIKTELGVKVHDNAEEAISVYQQKYPPFIGANGNPEGWFEVENGVILIFDVDLNDGTHVNEITPESKVEQIILIPSRYFD